MKRSAEREYARHGFPKLTIRSFRFPILLELSDAIVSAKAILYISRENACGESGITLLKRFKKSCPENEERGITMSLVNRV
jgi:hypothetical protein